MANLWHFFGLPDPEGPNNPKKKSKAKSAKPQENLGQQTLIPVAQPPLQISIPTATLETEQTTPSKENNLVAVPLGWKGPVSADGEPFHDLGVTNSARRSFPSRALRYVAPDDKKIPGVSLFPNTIGLSIDPVDSITSFALIYQSRCLGINLDFLFK